jgi:ATP-dependent DNA helicase RecG
MDLTGIVAGMRRTGVEYEDVEATKAAGGVPDSLVATLCSFANSRGGIVILGLDESAGFAATGVRDVPAMRDAVADIARRKLTPPLTPSIESVPFESVNLVVIQVDTLPPAQRPCFVTARGMYNGAYVRVGDGGQRLTPYEVDRLRENCGQPRWDEEPIVRATINDLDRGSRLRLVEVARRNSPRSFSSLSEDEALVRLGVLASHEDVLVPTLAGLLSVGAYPQEFFPQLIVSLAVHPHIDAGRPGPGGIRFLDSATVGGPVPELVVEVVQAVQRNLRVTSRVVGAGREEHWEIEPEVVREAIVNALMHRDYSPQARGTQIQVDLFPDRLTVTSPGGLFGNVRLELLGQSGTSSSRNARLAALLQEAGDPITGRPVAENRGSGLSMMIRETKRNTGLVPVFGANLNEFRVTVPRTASLSPERQAWAAAVAQRRNLTPEQIFAMAMAREGYDIDASLFSRLGLSSPDARWQLHELMEIGVLHSRSAGDGGPYGLATGLPEAGSEDGEPVGPAAVQPVSALAARVLQVLAGAGEATRAQLQEATGASRSGVIYALQQLVASGAVEAQGPPRSPRRSYRLSGR